MPPSGGLDVQRCGNRLAIAMSLLTVSSLALPTRAERPEGFEQILPRGRIAGIDAPVYVSAGRARIPADAWVLGFVLEARAYAYSLNLMNAHEVVNDEAAGESFAAVW